MTKHKVGNIHDKEHTSRGGWIIGHFMNEDSPLYSKDLEVKYSVMEPGDTAPKHFHPHGEDIFIIITGRIKVILDGTEYELGKGDYVYQKANSEETIVEVLEHTEIIVARTPSVEGNKVEVE